MRSGVFRRNVTTVTKTFRTTICSSPSTHRACQYASSSHQHLLIIVNSPLVPWERRQFLYSVIYVLEEDKPKQTRLAWFVTLVMLWHARQKICVLWKLQYALVSYRFMCARNIRTLDILLRWKDTASHYGCSDFNNTEMSLSIRWSVSLWT